MKIRPIKTEDTAKFVEFYKQLAKESEYLPFTLPEVEAKADEEEKFIRAYNDYKQVFVAEQDGEIVGYLGIARSHLSRITHSAKFTVGVLTDYQRRKIATRLIAFAEGWAAEKDIKRLEITVIEGNKGAVALFEQNGFIKEGTRKASFYAGDEYVDELFMAKVI